MEHCPRQHLAHAHAQFQKPRPEIAERFGELRRGANPERTPVELRHPVLSFLRDTESDAVLVAGAKPRLMFCVLYELGEAVLKKRCLSAIALSICSTSHGKRGSE